MDFFMFTHYKAKVDIKTKLINNFFNSNRTAIGRILILILRKQHFMKKTFLSLLFLHMFLITTVSEEKLTNLNNMLAL